MSRGHRSVPVCVRGVRDDGVVCEGRSRGRRRATSVCASLGVCVCLEGAEVCRKDYVPGPRTVLLWVQMGLCICQVGQDIRRITQLVSLRMHWPPYSPHSFMQLVQIEHPLCVRPRPRLTDSGDPCLLLGLSPSVPTAGRGII